MTHSYALPGLSRKKLVFSLGLLLAMLTLAPLPAMAQNKRYVNNRFVFHTFKPLVVARIDPLMSPGEIAEHAHLVIGGSNFNKTYDPVLQRQGKCSNMAVQADKSNYWMPLVYRVNENGSYSAMQSSVRIYYEFQQDSDLQGGQKIQPFPENYRMLAGSPNRKALDSSNPVDGAGQWWMRWSCSNYNGWTIPTFPCHNLVMSVFFPVCHNGQEFNASDPTAHTRYPTTEGYDGPRCPDTHPLRVPSVLMETFYYNADVPYHTKPLQYILANGDTTGYGLHADFANGWDTDVLQGAINDCRTPSVAEPANVACSHFVASYDETTAQNCMYENDVPDEPVGFKTPLSALPGCNLQWGSSGAKPTCVTRKGRQALERWVKPVQDLFQWSLWYTWTR